MSKSIKVFVLHRNDINSNLSLKQSKPSWLNSDNINNAGSGTSFDWGYGLINNNAYLAFYIGWISIQFRSNGLELQKRVQYGDSGWGNWTTV